MNQTWTSVDAYFERHLVPLDAALHGALATSEAAGLPAINITATQGKLLQLLATLCGARRILEIGTLGGFSAIWLARALPPTGRLVTLEINAVHAALAERNLTVAGVADRVDVRVGPATASLAAMIDAGVEPFDLVFIDADKVSTADYVRAALALSHPGTLIIIDNVVRGGAIQDSDSADPNVLGMQRAIDLVEHEPRLAATAVQTVGSKGYDGFLIALVVDAAKD